MSYQGLKKKESNVFIWVFAIFVFGLLLYILLKRNERMKSVPFSKELRKNINTDKIKRHRHTFNKIEKDLKKEERIIRREIKQEDELRRLLD